MTSQAREGNASGADGVRLFWRSWIPERVAASIFLIHGLGEHSGRYEEFARWMGKEGISLFCFDLRGHGRSEGPRGDTPAFHRFLQDVSCMERIFEMTLDEESRSVAPRFLMGHSLGGLIALRLLQERGEGMGGYTGAVISAPWLATPLPAWLRSFGRWLGRRFPGLAIPSGLDPRRLTRDPKKIREWREDPLIQTRLTGRLFLEVERVQRECLTHGAILRDRPLLFLIPDDDGVVSSRDTLEFVRGIDEEGHRVEILRGGKHEPLNDVDREDVFRLVGSWVKNFGPEGP